MQDRLKKHYNKLTLEVERTLVDEGVRAHTKKAAQTETLHAASCTKRKQVSPGTRCHHGKNLSNMLPQYAEVDMSFGIIPWSPIVVLRSGEANVLMEVTADNFRALFKIVQTQISHPDTVRDIAAIPKRQGRRPTSHPHAVIDSPRGKKYFVAAKGWMRCVKDDPSGSASSARAKRRFLLLPSSSRAGGKHPKSIAGKKRRCPEDVLGKDDDSNSCHSRVVSGSEDP